MNEIKVSSLFISKRLSIFNQLIQLKMTYLYFVTFYCVFLLPFFDSLTGALFKLGIMSEGALGSPSQLGRLIALFFLIVFIFNSKIENKIKKGIFYFSLYFLLIEIVAAFIHHELKPFLSGVVFFSKILFCILVYIFLSDWVNKDLVTYDFFFRIVIIYGVILSILLLASFLSGFHISNYGSKFATRGLFASGNGIGITIGVSALLSLYYSYISGKNLYFFLGLLMIISTAIIGTKAAFLFLILSTIYLTYVSCKKFPIISIVIAILLIIFVVPALIEILALVFENIISKFNKIEDKTVLLASSRDVFIRDAFDKLNVDGFSSLKVLFGGGAFYAYESFELSSSFQRKFLENDLFELFFCYGLIPAIGYLFFVSHEIVKAVRNKRLFLSFCLLMIFLHSILAGHVIFNGTSSIMLVFVLLLTKSSFHPKHLRLVK
ncbi:O-antigen polymerase [Colwellia sp. BRX10-4]|jgi:hypothetical protein|uniref:O-antigen polymerase n=1 Tax=Colwellia sp. BRX10-4 TaxID=2759843 RepID=UPI0015F51F33|nr:O-antigen polymerase [Colwellia sp. BRX10-4]MBA6396544.1 O-antigen ligase family protein [Colwellia sp. BRX10-4]